MFPINAESPICISFILCDLVIEDKLTHNKTFVNVFNAIRCVQLPSNIPRMFVVATLSNLRGPCDVAIRFKDPHNRVILQLDGRIETPSPIHVHDFIADVAGVPLTEPGVYFVEILCDRELIRERRFECVVRNDQRPT